MGSPRQESWHDQYGVSTKASAHREPQTCDLRFLRRRSAGDTSGRSHGCHFCRTTERRSLIASKSSLVVVARPLRAALPLHHRRPRATGQGSLPRQAPTLAKNSGADPCYLMERLRDMTARQQENHPAGKGKSEKQTDSRLYRSCIDGLDRRSRTVRE